VVVVVVVVAVGGDGDVEEEKEEVGDDNNTHMREIENVYKIIALDFKLSPCSKCCV
jgi:hypothetical protein